MANDAGRKVKRSLLINLKVNIRLLKYHTGCSTVHSIIESPGSDSKWRQQNGGK